MKFELEEFNKNLMGRKVQVFCEFRRTRQGKIKKWMSVPCGINQRKDGIITGVRWLQEGFTEYGSYDEPNHFVETGPRKLCYLVVTDPRREPLKVPPKQLEVIG